MTTKKVLKLHITFPLLGQSTAHWWIPPTKDQWPVTSGPPLKVQIKVFHIIISLCHYLYVRNRKRSRRMGCVGRTRSGWWRFQGHTSWGLRRTEYYHDRHTRARRQNHTGSRNTGRVGGAGTGRCAYSLCKNKHLHPWDLNKLFNILQNMFSNELVGGGAFAVVVGLADKIHFLEWKYLSFDSDISEITLWKY